MGHLLTIKNFFKFFYLFGLGSCVYYLSQVTDTDVIIKTELRIISIFSGLISIFGLLLNIFHFAYAERDLSKWAAGFYFISVFILFKIEYTMMHHGIEVSFVALFFLISLFRWKYLSDDIKTFIERTRLKKKMDETLMEYDD